MVRVEPTIKEDAEALAAAIELGAATPIEIVAWADRIILATAKPDSAICEVSLMRKQPRPNIASTLRHVEGDADPAVVRGLLIERLTKAHEDGLVTPEQLSKWIYDDAMRDADGWAANYGEAVSYWDALDLARGGVFGDYDSKLGEMMTFLRAAAATLLQDEAALDEIEIEKALK